MTVTSGKDYLLTAVFAENTYNVQATIEKFGGLGDGGKVQYKYAGIWSDFPSGGTPLRVPYDIGNIEVRAVAATGNVFLWWKGDISGPINTQGLNVNGNKNITAVFNRNSPGDNRSVLVNVVGEGNVTVQNAAIWGAGNWQDVPVGSPMVVPSGLTMDFLATPSDVLVNNKFIWWTGGLRGNEASKSLVIDGNKNITATFSNSTQTVNFVIVGSGKVQYLLDGAYEDAPASMSVPTSMGSLQLRASPAGGSEFIWWTGDVTGTSADASLALAGAVKNVTATFSNNARTVTAVTASGTMQYILDGKTFAFPAAGLRVPNGFAGLRLNVSGAADPITDWELNGILMGNDANPLSITVTEDQAYVASFTRPTWMITVIIGPNGTMTPNANFPVIEGENATFALKPDPGYTVSDVLVDGASVIRSVTGNSYVLRNVTADHTVEVVFDLALTKRYYITASSDTGASISPSGMASVTAKGSMTFSFSAKPGKEIRSIVIDGRARNDLIGRDSYTFSNVLMNHTIEIVSGDKIIRLTVDVVGGEGAAEYKVGSGSNQRMSGSATVSYGSSVTVHALPDNGYRFKEWINDDYGSVVGTDDTFGISNMGESVHLVLVLEKADEQGGEFPLTWIIIIVLAVLAVCILIYAVVHFARARES
jgi:hypothetical protein